MGLGVLPNGLIQYDLYVDHIKNFLSNDNLKLIKEIEIKNEKRKNNKETEGEEFYCKDKDKLDCEKIEDVRSTLSSNCRIIKIKDEETEISKWNEIEKNTPIDKHIIKRLTEHFGYSTFLPCQNSILKYALLYKDGSNSLLNGDIYIEVPTGLGKTLCYLVAILDYFLYTSDRNMFCLILTASDELVKQLLVTIEQFDIKNLICESFNLNTFSSNIYFDDPVDGVLKNCNVLVTTVYKFELLFYNNEDLFKNLKYLVIDEVDKILSYNKLNISTIINTLTKMVQNYQMETTCLYRSKYFLQKFLVSATLCKVSDNIMSLQLYRPIFFYQIISYPRNDEFYCLSENVIEKTCQLIKLLLEMDMKKKEKLNMLVFCKDEESTHILFRYLTVYFSYIGKNYFNIVAYYIHLTKSKKNKILQNFLDQKIHILICTDVISRGLDTVNTNFVVNFDIPKHYNVLTHRIGRVSRGNNRGTVYYFIMENEERIMQLSAQQRNVENIKKRNFDTLDLDLIEKNLIHIKPLVKNALKLETLDMLKYYKIYTYDALLKKVKN